MLFSLFQFCDIYKAFFSEPKYQLPNFIQFSNQYSTHTLLLYTDHSVSQILRFWSFVHRKENITSYAMST